MAVDRGWVDFDFGHSSLLVQFSLGRWEFGRIAWAAGQEGGTLRSKSTQPRSTTTRFTPEIYSEEHTSRIFRQSSNPISGFSMMEQVRLCAVWPMENWLGSSMNHIQGWITVGICYWHASQNRSLVHPVGLCTTSLRFAKVY